MLKRKYNKTVMKTQYTTLRWYIVVPMILVSMLLYGCTANEKESNGMKYSVKHGVLTIRGEGIMPDSSDVSSPNVDPEKVVEYEWKNEEGVSKIVIQDGVTSIGAGAFMYLSDVTEVELPDTVIVIRDGAFSLCGKLKRIKLSKNLEEVSMSTFYGCNSLKQVELPEGLKTIGHGAFAGCAIEEIYIPSSVADISENIFGGCSELKSVSVSPQNMRYYSVDGILFDDKTNTLLTYPASQEVESYDVPEGIQHIAMNAFWGCKMNTITLPESITSIGRSAFNNSDIETIYYKGSMKQWNQINIERADDNIQSINIVFLK